jgi:plasmid stabilization system protein ParE
MEYRIKAARRAVVDADEAFDWIARRAPRTAARWYAKLFAAIDTLETNPARCSVASESDACPEEVRQLLFGKRRNAFRILFVIRGDMVLVLRIVRGARQSLTVDELAENGP